jgi:hypothetical protein
VQQALVLLAQLALLVLEAHLDTTDRILAM